MALMISNTCQNHCIFHFDHFVYNCSYFIFSNFILLFSDISWDTRSHKHILTSANFWFLSPVRYLGNKHGIKKVETSTQQGEKAGLNLVAQAKWYFLITCLCIHNICYQYKKQNFYCFLQNLEMQLNI